MHDLINFTFKTEYEIYIKTIYINLLTNFTSIHSYPSYIHKNSIS